MRWRCCHDGITPRSIGEKTSLIRVAIKKLFMVVAGFTVQKGFYFWRWLDHPPTKSNDSLLPPEEKKTGLAPMNTAYGGKGQA
jgi:hypothetical protein